MQLNSMLAVHNTTVRGIFQSIRKEQYDVIKSFLIVSTFRAMSMRKKPAILTKPKPVIKVPKYIFLFPGSQPKD